MPCQLYWLFLLKDLQFSQTSWDVTTLEIHFEAWFIKVYNKYIIFKFLNELYNQVTYRQQNLEWNSSPPFVNKWTAYEILKHFRKQDYFSYLYFEILIVWGYAKVTLLHVDSKYYGVHISVRWVRKLKSLFFQRQ